MVETKRSLSVVIASYNSAEWLPSTIDSLRTALSAVNWSVEIIVVDDGSTDDTQTTLAGIGAELEYPLRVITQSNMGRFLARWAGVQAASYEQLLILDSRLLVHESSFSYVDAHWDATPELPWNGHVVTDPASPLVGQFWLVPTHIFWNEYLADPRPMLITTNNFDRVPKGTGFLLLRKDLFVRASEHAWPAKNAHLTSDDTKLLRFIVSQTPIKLDPGFSATYRPRTTFSNFVTHSFQRGTLFVDSYAGTGVVRNVILIALVAVPIIVLLGLVALFITGNWPTALIIVAVGLLALCIPAVAGAVRKSPARAIVSYFAYVLPFGIAFITGLTRGLFVHRRSFAWSGTPKEATE